MDKKTKPTYRIRNWQQYNQALINRGRITLWVEKKTFEVPVVKLGKKRGRPFSYADEVIRCALVLRAVFSLTLRSLEGFLSDLLKLQGIDFSVPHYSTFSIRAKKLSVSLLDVRKKGPLNLVVDSTGLKVYGEGEWKVRNYGFFKRRTWMKFHLALDHQTQEIVVSKLTDNKCHDSEVMPSIIDAVPREIDINSVIADGAYDPRDSRNAIAWRGAKAIIPPRKGASSLKTYRNAYYGPGLRERNEAIEDIKRRGENGLAEWKKEKGYHRRSLGEVAMFRLKTIFGDRLMSRTLERQATEMLIKSHALNRMTQLGMPQSVKI